MDYFDDLINGYYDPNLDPNKSNTANRNGQFEGGYEDEGHWFHYSRPTHKTPPPRDRMNDTLHDMDHRWGQDEDDFGPQRPRRPRPDKFRPRKPEDEVIMNTPESQHYTVDDIVDVNGTCDQNLKLLKIATKRVSELTDVIRAINDNDKGIDLVEIMRRIPYVSYNFRAILNSAFGAEMRNYMDIITKLNEKIYGGQIEGGETTQSDDDPIDAEFQEIENQNDDQQSGNDEPQSSNTPNDEEISSDTGN